MVGYRPGTALPFAAGRYKSRASFVPSRTATLTSHSTTTSGPALPAGACADLLAGVCPSPSGTPKDNVKQTAAMRDGRRRMVNLNDEPRSAAERERPRFYSPAGRNAV